MYRLIVSDMDDTLLRSDATISERTERALLTARALGAQVVLASGRMTRAMRPYAAQLRITTPLISFNGGAVSDPASGEILFSDCIDGGLARRACAMAEQMGLHVQAYWGDDYYFEKANQRTERYALAVGVTGRETGRKLSECIPDQCVKLLVIDSPERLAEVRPVFAEALEPEMGLTTSRSYYLEFNAPEATKHNALRRLAAQMDIAPDEIIAFGDGQNDLGMLKMAGLGYVPQNACQAVKHDAPNLMPSNDEDGVAQIIETLLAQGKIGGRE